MTKSKVHLPHTKRRQGVAPCIGTCVSLGFLHNVEKFKAVFTTSRLCWDLQPSPGKPGHSLHGRFSYQAILTLRFFSRRLTDCIEHQQARKEKGLTSLYPWTSGCPSACGESHREGDRVCGPAHGLAHHHAARSCVRGNWHLYL